MKYSLLIAVLMMFTLAACGDPKPAQYPPSLYKDFEDPLTDEALAEVQEAAEAAADELDEEAEEVEEAADELDEEAEEVEEAADELDEEAEEDAEEEEADDASE